MKNLILKLIGIDVKTLNKLITLQKAVDKLTSATKDSCKTSLQIISLLKLKRSSLKQTKPSLALSTSGLSCP